MRLRTLFLLIVSAAIAAFAALNWSTVITPGGHLKVGHEQFK